MDGVNVFLAEIALSLAVSATILVRLQALMRRIGREVCERGGGAADFWISYTQLMVMIAPLLLVSWLSRAGEIGGAIAQLKSSLSIVLFGQFIGLALVGRAVWKSMVSPAPSPAPSPIEPKATS